MCCIIFGMAYIVYIVRVGRGMRVMPTVTNIGTMLYIVQHVYVYNNWNCAY